MKKIGVLFAFLCLGAEAKKPEVIFKADWNYGCITVMFKPPIFVRATPETRQEITETLQAKFGKARFQLLNDYTVRLSQKKLTGDPAFVTGPLISLLRKKFFREFKFTERFFLPEGAKLEPLSEEEINRHMTSVKDIRQGPQILMTLVPRTAGIPGCRAH